MCDIAVTVALERGVAASATRLFVARFPSLVGTGVSCVHVGVPNSPRFRQFGGRVVGGRVGVGAECIGSEFYSVFRRGV